jgi:catechol 2,3-dioxygenase-like lactoylglutathione lyase family enzyme
MKAFVYHIQVNVRDATVSLPFYRDLLHYLEFQCVHDDTRVAGYSDGRMSIWLIETGGGHTARGFHRKRTGLNHIAFRVPDRTDVDRFTQDFLAQRGLAPLYKTPREFPEYRPGYYAVFFEDPDRLKLEVVHIPEPPQAPDGDALPPRPRERRAP